MQCKIISPRAILLLSQSVLSSDICRDWAGIGFSTFAFEDYATTVGTGLGVVLMMEQCKQICLLFQRMLRLVCDTYVHNICIYAFPVMHAWDSL